MRTGGIARAVLTALGVLLLAYVVYSTGPGRLWEQISSLGPWLPVILVISSTWFVLNTLGWRAAFEPVPGREPVPLLSLLRVHLVSEAISNVTPLLSLGGEPLKVVLLRRWRSAEELTASVINDNVVHLTSAAAFMLLGVVLGQDSLAVDRATLRLLWLFVAAIGLGTLLLLTGARFALVSKLTALGAALRPSSTRMASLVQRAAMVDVLVARFVTKRAPSFALSFAFHVGGRLMGAVEAWVILRAAGVSASFGAAVFVIAVVHVMVNLVFSFVSGQWGVQETAASLLFGAMGLDPSLGVAVMLTRRIRGLFWIAVGLVLLGRDRSLERTTR